MDDADDVIAKHQKRLEQHRQFLRDQSDSSNMTTPTKEVVAQGAHPAGNKAGSRGGAGGISRYDASGAVEAGRPAWNRTTSPTSTNRGTPRGGHGSHVAHTLQDITPPTVDDQPSGDNQHHDDNADATHILYQDSNHSMDQSHQQLEDHGSFMSSSQLSSARQQPRGVRRGGASQINSAAATAATSVNGESRYHNNSGSDSYSPERVANVRESFAYTNPTGGEEYVVASPTRLYERGQMFVSAHNRQISAMRGERNAREMAECSFQPNREKVIASMSSARRSGREDDSHVPQTRQQHQKQFLHQSNRQQTQQQQHRNPNDWNSSSRLDRTRSPSANAGNKQLALSPSICSHIARQESARHQKRALNTRNFKDGSGWTGKPTVTKEFDFAQHRVAHGISSLRKPVVMDYGLKKRQEDSRAMKSPRSEDDDALFVRARARTPRVAEVSRPAARHVSVEQPQHDDDDAEHYPDEQAEADEQHNDNAEVELQERLSYQDTEIDKLHGIVASLQRELGVAKAKVREVTIQSSRGEGVGTGSGSSRSTSAASGTLPQQGAFSTFAPAQTTTKPHVEL